MLRGALNSNFSQPSPQSETTWLDELVTANPQGVMQVLDRNGYSGYLAPQDQNELLDAAYDFLDRKGEDAVIELIKAHPLYDVIAGVATEESIIPVKYKNASGDITSIITSFKSINYRKLIETFLLIVGAVYVAKGLWSFLSSE